jgi:hypothetical protein
MLRAMKDEAHMQTLNKLVDQQEITRVADPNCVTQ